MLGLKVGHYRIVDILGEGGMGIVYKAVDIHLERDIALKILNSQALNNPQFIERFKREARNQAQLNHPNIVPVYGFTEEAHVLGIVMEYVEGETLENIIDKKGRIPLLQALEILKQILHGAAYAHSKGFVHRDIKPSNIIVNNDGIAKIMDFGISKSLNETKGITRTGSKLGTILYMSPEQIKAVEPTNQSDIYSIGITFYEMISGKNPFDIGTDYQIMEAHLKMNPPRLSAMIGNVEQEVDDIIARALNKSLKKRYASCEEFLEDIDGLLEKLKARKEKTNSRVKEKTAARTIEIPSQKNPAAAKIRFYLFVFFFLVIFSGLAWLIYDAVSGYRGSENNGNELQGLLDSYKLNPGYTANTGWKAITTPTHEQLNAIAFIDDSTGFACGYNGTLLKTTNGGNTWISILDTLNPFGKLNFYDIEFVSSSYGFIAASEGNLLSFDPVTGYLQRVNTPATESLFDIFFLKNSGTGFIAGAGGTILRTENGGATWDKIKSPANLLLYKIYFANNKTGYIVGWDGAVLNTKDKGKTWTLPLRVTDKYLRGIHFINDEIGFAVGGGGEIYRTNDGGGEWELIKSGIISGLYDVWFFNQKNGIILGSKGEILLSDDGGKSWKITRSGQYAGLTGIAFTPSKKIFLSGQNGLILTSLNK
jgi:serine/threonine-protein kinase